MRFNIYTYKYNSKTEKVLKNLLKELKNKSFVLFWIKIKDDPKTVKIFELSKTYIWYTLSLNFTKIWQIKKDNFSIESFSNWSFINKHKIEKQRLITTSNFKEIFDTLCNDQTLLYKDSNDSIPDDLSFLDSEESTKDLFSSNIELSESEITVGNIWLKTEIYRHEFANIIDTISYENLSFVIDKLKLLYEKFLGITLSEIPDRENKKQFLQDEFIKEIAERYIFAFDLDDTLIESNTKIHLMNEQGQRIESLWTKDYELALHNNPEKYNEKNWNLDFSDFSDMKKVIKGISYWKINKILVEFLTFIKSIGCKCIVVTARSHEKAVKVWLLNIWLFDKFSYIYCINAPDKKYEDFLKQNYSKSSSDKKLHILKYYLQSKREILDKIVFFDDSPKHIKTIDSFSSDKIKTIQV